MRKVKFFGVVVVLSRHYSHSVTAKLFIFVLRSSG
jgi:hypothetical protein